MLTDVAALILDKFHGDQNCARMICRATIQLFPHLAVEPSDIDGIVS